MIPASAVFELVDRDLQVGDEFRWPNGDQARTWRITEILDREVDALSQRVRAVPHWRTA